MHVREKVDGLSTFVQRLEEIRAYLKNVSTGRIPINNQILYNLQNIFNMIPNLNVDELVRSTLVKTNDMYLIIYLSSLLRSVIALHGLLNNKIKFRDVDDILDKKDTTAAAGATKEKDAAPKSPVKKN
jgi:26S proteasome regulatory subunit N8